MPPKKGGTTRGRTRNKQTNSRANGPSSNVPPTPRIEDQVQEIKTKSNFAVAPLIEEVQSLTKVKLNYIIKNHLSDVKISNIQSNRSNSFTIYAADVKSFNRILNDLSLTIQTIENLNAVVYVPRSIQRILENNKELFVKEIDLEIIEDDIGQTLTQQGYKIEKVSRLKDKDNLPLKTLKITFSDSYNRDLCVKIGLQIDSMHFLVEPANHINTPMQCYKCFKYGHVAKYCKSDDQICSSGGDKHKYENCPNSNQQPVCCNCKRIHIATSRECPKFKEHQQKIQKTIERYSSTNKQNNTLQDRPNWKDSDEFPPLQIMDKINQTSIIETLTEKALSIIEQAAERIFEKLKQKLETLVRHLGNKYNVEMEDTDKEKIGNSQNINNQPSTTTTQDQQTRIQHCDESTPIISVNGEKRKYESSPGSSSEKNRKYK